jgi:dipeptidyl aminopeptidase/acylaminoacyl peptidase
VAPDGSDLRELSAIPLYTRGPALSPDGSEIAYSWSRCWYCAPEIRVANIDGTDSRTVTSPSGCAGDGVPSWSPDGRTILYSEPTGCRTFDSKLYTVPATGGPSRDLGIFGSGPVWGPTRIAYQTFGGLTTANPDGSDPVTIAANGAFPAWSSDGRLAYATAVNDTTVVVGSTQVQLPFARVESLAWSPDGTRFVVSAEQTPGLTTGYDASAVSWR